MSRPLAPIADSRLQITLHWLVAAVVLVVFVAGDNSKDAFDVSHNGSMTLTSLMWISIHVVAGLVIFCAMFWRLGL